MPNNRNVYIEDEAAAEAIYDEEYRRAIEIIDLSQDNDDNERPQSAGQARRRGKTTKIRTPSLSGTHRSVQTADEFHVGDFVELISPIGEWKVEFLEVKQIWVDRASHELTLRGIPYTRNFKVGGRLELKCNELCQILEVDEDDRRPDEQQSMIDARLHHLRGIREFHKTNTEFTSPRNCRFGNDAAWREAIPGLEGMTTLRYKQKYAPLTCRWKMKVEYLDARYRRASKPFGGALIHLAENEVVDPEYRISDEKRRSEWNGAPTQSTNRKFTFGDAFSGAGGASSGASIAGLEPTIAIDNWDTACESYRRNFRRAQLYEQDMTDFINSHGEVRVDILHMSPPCQYWSPARVYDGQNDEANRAATYACEHLLMKLRPRVFTMEQTYGLLQTRYLQYFNKLLQSFTRLGYSVQWRHRVEFVRYGLPQNRKRLIIIGCAPGETMPPWPVPTHGPAAGLRPTVTEAQAIGRFPPYVTLHDVHSARRIDAPARNPNSPLMRTIVCSGAQGVFHYNGQREYTLREYATLQGFPLTHQFSGPSRTAIKKQIGNAFPASVAQVFYNAIRESLEDQDKRRRNGVNGVEAPAALPNRTPQAQGLNRIPAFSRVNGNLDDNEALRKVLRDSLHVNVCQVDIIELDKSDDESELRGQMGRLSVEPSLVPRGQLLDRPNLVSPHNAPPQPATAGSSNANFGSSPQQRGGSWAETVANWTSRLETPSGGRSRHRVPSSAASSVTLDNSPRPSPSPSPSLGSSKRKRNALGTEDDEQKKKRKCVEFVDLDDMGVELGLTGRPSVADNIAASGRQTASVPYQEKRHGRYSISELDRMSKLSKVSVPSRVSAYRPSTVTDETDWHF